MKALNFNERVWNSKFLYLTIVPPLPPLTHYIIETIHVFSFINEFHPLTKLLIEFCIWFNFLIPNSGLICESWFRRFPFFRSFQVGCLGSWLLSQHPKPCTLGFPEQRRKFPCFLVLDPVLIPVSFPCVNVFSLIFFRLQTLIFSFTPDTVTCTWE